MNKSSQVIDVSDYGAEADSRKNAVSAVRKAIEANRNAGPLTITFPKGRYDFGPDEFTERVYHQSNTTDINPKRCAILLDKMKDVVLDGNGSEFIFHGRLGPVTIDGCKNIVIKNFSIDWDIPLTAEGKVLAVTDSYMDLGIDPVQFPWTIEKGKLVFVGEGWKSQWNGTIEFDSKTRKIPLGSGDVCPGDGWGAYTAEVLDKDKVRLNHAFKYKPAVGNVLVLRHSERDHAGIFIVDSVDTTLQNVDIHHTAGLGVLAQFSEDVHLDRCHVRPNPAKNRFLSGHDDGAHISNCRGLIRIENCEFAGLMDDPINIHGTSVRVLKKLDSNRLLCRFMHDQSMGMVFAGNGDRIGFINSQSMDTIAEGRAVSFRALSLQDFEIGFAEPVPESLKEKDALENLTWAPDAHISNCIFRSCRARGILVSTAGKVLIENNLFESSGNAVLVAGDANCWYESGAVRDVLIRGNTFDDCLTSMYQFCEAVISIYPEIPKPWTAGRPFHRNIRIEDNLFKTFDYPVLYAKSVDGLTFCGNRIERTHTYEPWHSRKVMVTVEYSRNVRVQDNRLGKDVLGRDVQLVAMPPDELTSDLNHYW